MLTSSEGDRTPPAPPERRTAASCCLPASSHWPSSPFLPLHPLPPPPPPRLPLPHPPSPLLCPPPPPHLSSHKPDTPSGCFLSPSCPERYGCSQTRSRRRPAPPAAPRRCPSRGSSVAGRRPGRFLSTSACAEWCQFWVKSRWWLGAGSPVRPRPAAPRDWLRAEGGMTGESAWETRWSFHWEALWRLPESLQVKTRISQTLCSV